MPGLKQLALIEYLEFEAPHHCKVEVCKDTGELKDLFAQVAFSTEYRHMNREDREQFEEAWSHFLDRGQLKDLSWGVVA